MLATISIARASAHSTWSTYPTASNDFSFIRAPTKGRWTQRRCPEACRCSTSVLGCPGTVDLCALPPTLKAIKLTKSAFAGSISLLALPGVLHTLSLTDNHFQGVISLDKLSPNMKRMSLAKNNFSGCISFESLSTSLVYLDLSANAFSGELDFPEIPPLLEFLFVNGNNFTGSVCFTEMKAIQLLNASDNDLQGTAVVPVYANGELVDLMGNGISAVETPDREVHPREGRMLTNSTSARDISRLRKDLEYLKSF